MSQYDNIKQITGLRLDQIDPKLAQYDLVFAGEAKPKLRSKDWRPLAPDFRRQLWFPICVAMAHRTVVNCFERVENGQNVEINPAWLFFTGGGGKWGSRIANLGDVGLEKGFVLEKDKSMLDPANFTWSDWSYIEKYSVQVTPEALERALAYKIKAYSWVNPSNMNLVLDAMDYSPLVIAVEIGDTYQNDYAERPTKFSGILHALALLYVDDYGNKYCLDSLQYRGGFDGIRVLAPDYPVLSFYSYRDMPNDWKEKQDQAKQKEFAICLNHYGKPRNLAKEQEVAQKMVKAFKAFKNQSVWEASGRFWTVYVNAIVYGGYSLEYTKGWKWFAGDVINDCYFWRRAGKHIFDFNKERSQN